jgi:SH3-like domain-containing protein
MLILAGTCRRRGGRRAAGPGILALLLAAGFCLATGGCSHLRGKPAGEYVYVTAKQTFLRDRVAAVSNRTGTVENGEKLEVLEHGRRFFRVKAPNGEQGWIDEKAVATQEIFDAFQALAKAHASDPAVASAVVQDEVNLHLRPGRDTEKFYRLQEGDKLQLLERATLPKPLPGGVAPVKSASKGTPANPASGTGVDTALPPIAMEDWWLARDAHGRAGWLLSRMLAVDVPDSVGKYAEGQRMVGAYVLTTVSDPEAGPESGVADNTHIPIYLTVLSPYLAGLPYDFDQVRVFTWNLKMHRYETAFREKNMEGYLPVATFSSKDPYGKAVVAQTPLPTFTYKVLAADAGPVVPDPVTGMVKPGRTIEKTYRLVGNIVQRVAPPGYKDEPETHPVAEEKKDKAAKKKR